MIPPVSSLKEHANSVTFKIYIFINELYCIETTVLGLNIRQK